MRQDIFLKKSRFNVEVPLTGNRALVHNTNSRALAVWDAEEFRQWSLLQGTGFSSSALHADFVSAAQKAGFLVAQEIDEIEVIKAEYQRHRFSTSSMILTITPTLACNFACAYCFQGLDKPTRKMVPEVEQAIEEYVDLSVRGLRSLSVVWYGGEPLMGKDIIFRSAKRYKQSCEAHGVKYSSMIVTNGYFLDLDTAHKLVDCSVEMAQVTIDGPVWSHDARRHLTSGKGTYDRVLRNIKEVIEGTDLRISVRVNIDTKNVDSIYELIDDLVARDLNKTKKLSVYFAPVEAMTDDCSSCAEDTMQKTAYGADEAALIDYAASKGLCQAPATGRFMGTCQAVRPNALVVLPDGDLHKCWDTVSQRDKRIGTIFSVTEALQSKQSKEWMRWSPFDHPVCRECPLLPACSGACAFKTVHNEQTHGEAAELPCPSWKFNMAERIFLRAKMRGVLSDQDWDPATSPTMQATGDLLTGQSHSSMTEISELA